MGYLSRVFKYISHSRTAGHQIGRKVGDMLEVLTYAAIANNDELLCRLQVEPKLFGFSEAGHKVEFILNNERRFENGIPNPINGGNLENVQNLIGFIECKKVGVEQTVNTSFKKKFNKTADKKGFIIPHNEEFNIGFNPRGIDIQHTYKLNINDENKLTISKVQDANFNTTELLENDFRIIFTLSNEDYQSEVLTNAESLRDISYDLKSCRILEILEINDDHIVAILNDCLAGPQTPEKAKQSSFVALDVRKNRFNQFDMRENEQEFISVLVLTEFSHWEQKSQNMITSCIDKNFIVDDELIIEAFQRFEEEFGVNFYDCITKEQFERNEQVRSLAKEIVANHDNKIFKDITDNQYKKFDIENGLLVFN